MAEPTPEQLTDWLEPVPTPTLLPADPGRYVCSFRALTAVTTFATLVLLGGGYALVRGRDTNWIFGYVLFCVIIGLMQTLAATAWGAAIAMTESGRCGSLFVLFPPYMFYYAATRWRWMAQPSILFLSGLGLALGGLYAGVRLLEGVSGSI